VSGWTKLEKRQITEKRDGAVYKTKVVGFEWFPINNQPPLYVEDKDGFIWVSTSDFYFGKEKPQ
jgi:hypothetical protein